MIADDFQACFAQLRRDRRAGRADASPGSSASKRDDPVANYLADIFTLPASLAGLPGMSVPAGFGEGGMPVGLQLIGNYFDEGHAAARRARVPAGDRLARARAGGVSEHAHEHTQH